jgi:hypothetical protein
MPKITKLNCLYSTLVYGILKESRLRKKSQKFNLFVGSTINDIAKKESLFL